MKYKFIFKSIEFILAFIIIVQIAPCAFAHNTSQEGILAKYYIKNAYYEGWYIGGDDVGWSIDENLHTNGTNIYYTLKEGDDYISNYKKCITEGAAKWNYTVSIKEGSSSGSGTLYTYSAPGSNIVALSCDFKKNSSGHFTSWAIKINRAKTVSPTTIAHEFGHIIGLNDLFESKSKNKLMYEYEDTRTVTDPTDYDRFGAKVITGQHIDHQWSYKYYSTSNGITSHITYCSYCKGYGASTDKKIPK